MKIAYLDSNVFLAKYMPSDPYYASSCRIFEENFVHCVSSTLSIVEVAAGIGRSYSKIELADSISDVIKELDTLPVTDRICAFIRYIFNDLTVKFYSHLGSEDLVLDHENVRLFSDYARAYSYASRFRLKALDLLHIAALKNILIEGKTSVDYLVTGDKEILKRKSEINQELEITTIDPDALVQIEAR